MEHISGGSVTHLSYFSGTCDLAEKRVFTGKDDEDGFCEKLRLISYLKIRPGMPY